MEEHERHRWLDQTFGAVCRTTRCNESRRRTLEEIVNLAVELAREGREGRKIGTLFVIGDVDAVLEQSRPLILDPLHGHQSDLLRVERPDFRETVKELAQLDGAFVLRDDGRLGAGGGADPGGAGDGPEHGAGGGCDRER